MEKTIAQKEKEVVIARLEVIPSRLSFSVGSENKVFSKNQLIEEIMKDSQIGQDFIKVQFELLRSLKDGSLMQALVS